MTDHSQRTGTLIYVVFVGNHRHGSSYDRIAFRASTLSIALGWVKNRPMTNPAECDAKVMEYLLDIEDNGRVMWDSRHLELNPPEPTAV